MSQNGLEGVQAEPYERLRTLTKSLETLRHDFLYVSESLESHLDMV